MFYLYRLFPVFIFVALNAGVSQAQRLKKADKQIIGQLARHSGYLSSPAVANVQKSRMEYIAEEFKKNGLAPKDAAGGYLCSFEVTEGMESAPGSSLFINGKKIPAEQFMPLLKSPAVELEAAPSLALKEAGQPWFLDIGELIEKLPAGEQVVSVKAGPAGKVEENAAGKELISGILAKAADAFKKGATALFLYNTSSRPDGLAYNSLEKEASLPLPVVYVKQATAGKYFEDVTAMLDIKLKVKFTEKRSNRTYVAGLIDNHAAATYVIRSTDDAGNAPVLIELARLLKNARSKDRNYLLVAFSDDQKNGRENDHRDIPLTADYKIEAGTLATDTGKLHYIRSILETLK